MKHIIQRTYGLSSKDQLESQNALLKSQIETLKGKIVQIQANPQAHINPTDNSANGLLTSLTRQKCFEDEQILSLAKKIDYYKDEIAKKKIQNDNNIDLAKIRELKGSIKAVQDKISALERENVALVRVYNNQIKGVNQTSMQLDFHEEEERLTKLIKENKAKYKDTLIKNKEIEAKLKDQRLLYSNLNEKISRIKETIKTIKLNENKKPEMNYEEEIAKLEEEIKEEQSKKDKEEEYYNEIKQKQQMTIDKLTEEIIQKKEVLKEKGNEIKMIQINERKKKSIETPPVDSTQSDKEIEPPSKEEEGSSKNNGSVFITSNIAFTSEKDRSREKEEESKVPSSENQVEEGEASRYGKKESSSLIVINNFEKKEDKNDNDNDQALNLAYKEETEVNKQGEIEELLPMETQDDNNPIRKEKDQADVNTSELEEQSQHSPPSLEEGQIKSETNALESSKKEDSELDYGDGDE